MSIIIKKALVAGKVQDIYIEENKISEISDNINVEAENRIDGSNFAAMPSFANCHTHSAMTMFRGYGENMPLQRWLEEKIWPAEAKLTEEDVYVGSKLACIEMIKTGTTFFNDMYMFTNGTARAADEFGMRAQIAPAIFDFFSSESLEGQKKNVKTLHENSKQFSSRVKFGLGPHAIYTVSKDGLIWCKDYADKNNLNIHFHISETEFEVDNCIKDHGMRPIEYLDKIGFLGKNVSLAHAVWLRSNEFDIISKVGSTLIHNPVSNMKLAVSNAFDFKAAQDRKIPVTLGTDGCSSNNNLNMFDEMKTAALLQKHHFKNALQMTAQEVYDSATKVGFKSFGIDAGVVEEGKLADLMLVDLKKPEMNPRHSMVSNMVYSATPEVVNTTICDGEILMQDRIIKDEEKIIEELNEVANKICN